MATSVIIATNRCNIQSPAPPGLGLRNPPRDSDSAEEFCLAPTSVEFKTISKLTPVNDAMDMIPENEIAAIQWLANR